MGHVGAARPMGARFDTRTGQWDLRLHSFKSWQFINHSEGNCATRCVWGADQMCRAISLIRQPPICGWIICCTDEAKRLVCLVHWQVKDRVSINWGRRWIGRWVMAAMQICPFKDCCCNRPSRLCWASELWRLFCFGLRTAWADPLICCSGHQLLDWSTWLNAFRWLCQGVGCVVSFYVGSAGRIFCAGGRRKF